MLMMTYSFDKVFFIAFQIHILATDIDKNNLDNDKDFNEDDPDNIIRVRLLAWRSKFKKRKVLKKRLAKN